MKKIIIIVIFLLIITLGFYYLFLDKNSFQKSEHISSEININKIESDITEGIIGDLVFQYKPEVSLMENESDISLIFNNLQLIDSLSPKKYIQGSLVVNRNENVNKEKLSIENWLEIDGNNFEYDKQAPTSYKIEYKTIANQKSSYHYFYPRIGFRSEYYDTVLVYIPYKTDIYELWYFKLPKDSNSEFTSPDIKQINDYEKLVEEIIQSIRFVE